MIKHKPNFLKYLLYASWLSLVVELLILTLEIIRDHDFISIWFLISGLIVVISANFFYKMDDKSELISPVHSKKSSIFFRNLVVFIFLSGHLTLFAFFVYIKFIGLTFNG
jgi:hypothetical protein